MTTYCSFSTRSKSIRKYVLPSKVPSETCWISKTCLTCVKSTLVALMLCSCLRYRRARFFPSTFIIFLPSIRWAGPYEALLFDGQSEKFSFRWIKLVFIRQWSIWRRKRTTFRTKSCRCPMMLWLASQRSAQSFSSISSLSTCLRRTSSSRGSLALRNAKYLHRKSFASAPKTKASLRHLCHKFLTLICCCWDRNHRSLETIRIWSARVRLLSMLRLRYASLRPTWPLSTLVESKYSVAGAPQASLQCFRSWTHAAIWIRPSKWMIIIMKRLHPSKACCVTGRKDLRLYKVRSKANSSTKKKLSLSPRPCCPSQAIR